VSEDHVEIVRMAYEVGYLNRRVDVPGVGDRFEDGYLFHTRPGFPGRLAYRKDEMTELWADLDSTYMDYELSPENYETIGGDVLVRSRQSARLRGSEVRLDESVFHLWRLRDGKVIETWTYSNEQDALAAAEAFK
jgi:ketosteroid isomerase-like protein